MTLKELIDNYAMFGMSDLEIIQKYFIDNNMESEGLSMIPALAKSQTEKVQRQLDYARTWLPNQMDMSEQIKDNNQLRAWKAVVDHCLLSLDFPDYVLDLVKAEIPNMKAPKYYFVPAYEWLKKKYNIKFKDDKGE